MLLRSTRCKAVACLFGNTWCKKMLHLRAVAPVVGSWSCSLAVLRLALANKTPSKTLSKTQSLTVLVLWKDGKTNNDKIMTNDPPLSSVDS